MLARATLLVVMLGGMAVPPASAQTPAEPTRDGVRAAASLEAAGDFAGAERALAAELEADPTSLPALLAYERVLTLQRREAELLPALERLLQRDRGSVLAHQMRLRTYAGLGRVEELERAGRAWISVAPRLETPYRELARHWRELGEMRRAADVLEQGKRRIGRPDALALELGDLYAAAGDGVRAAREWSRAIGDEGQGFILVQRRLAALPDGGARYAGEFVAALLREPTTAPRRRVAVQAAIDAGHAEQALAAAQSLLPAVPERERQSLLVELARRADGAGVPPVAYWAYGELLARSRLRGERALALQSRYAELALALGDTALASAEYASLEAALAPGSPERRQAMAVRIELTARDGDVEAATQELRAFRAEFANATELDALATAVADALLAGGDDAAAERALSGVSGPRSALLRGRILLRRGETARARNALLESAPRLRGAEATRTISLAALLGRLSAPANELLVGAMGVAADGETPVAVERIVLESVALPAEDRAALLDFAAALAEDAGQTDYAEQVRRELVDAHPDAREAAAALLSLARELVRRGAYDDAELLLERLLLEHPRSALAPQARRELERIAAAGGR